MYVCMYVLLGEFKNDKRCGEGTELYANGDAYRLYHTHRPYYRHGRRFSLLWSYSRGSFYNNQRHGLGLMIHLNTAEYRGQWINGMKEGEGIFTFRNNDVYAGMWHRDRKHGNFCRIYYS